MMPIHERDGHKPEQPAQKYGALRAFVIYIAMDVFAACLHVQNECDCAKTNTICAEIHGSDVLTTMAVIKFILHFVTSYGL